MGFGLALAHELAQLHGGDIEVNSVPGEGSAFTITLPLEKIEVPGKDIEAEAAPAESIGGNSSGGFSGEEKLGMPPDSPLQSEAEPDLSRRSEAEPDRTTILIIEDHDDVRAYVRRVLAPDYRVLEAGDGESGLRRARKALPDLIVSDVMLPGADGFEIARELKTDAATDCIPVIMLTAKTEEDDRVRGLELGADDYVTKPFSPRELVSRVRAVLRRTERSREGKEGAIQVDDRLKIDFDRREVWVEGKLVKLRPTEYRLLYHLVQNAGWVVTHDQLLVKVWGYEYRDEPHYVRLYINYLRQKLEKDPSNPKYILTERGVGYRFVDYKRQKAESK